MLLTTANTKKYNDVQHSHRLSTNSKFYQTVNDVFPTGLESSVPVSSELPLSESNMNRTTDSQEFEFKGNHLMDSSLDESTRQ